MEERRGINSPVLYGNFSPEDLSYEYISDMSEKLHFEGKLQSAKLAADLGSGVGNSTIILKKLVPNAEIHTVDMIRDRIIDNNRKEIGGKHAHFYESIHSYLERFEDSGTKLDVVLFRAVPEHQLEKEGGYSLLSEAMSTGGLVVSIGDTGLDYNHMNQHFNPLFERDYKEGYGVFVWQKK